MLDTLIAWVRALLPSRLTTPPPPPPEIVPEKPGLYADADQAVRRANTSMDLWPEQLRRTWQERPHA